MTIEAHPNVQDLESHPDIPKNKDTDFRFILQNMNSLPRSNSVEFLTLMSQLYIHDVDMLQMTEINFPLNVSNLSYLYKQKIHSLWKMSSLL